MAEIEHKESNIEYASRSKESYFARLEQWLQGLPVEQRGKYLKRNKEGTLVPDLDKLATAEIRDRQIQRILEMLK